MKEPSELFEPIRDRRVFERVSDRIKTLIFEGKLKAGDKLPSETALAQQFNVGRQTVREALRLLEISGFITVQRGTGGGPLIMDTILNRISDLYLDAFRMKKVTLAELTAARQEIERTILLHAYDHIRERDLNALQDNVQKAKAKVAGNMVATEENIQFHSLLARSSGNHVFVIVAESMMAVLGDFLSRLAPDVETSAKVIEDHDAILKAIVGRDKSQALLLMERHLVEVENRLQVFMQKIA